MKIDVSDVQVENRLADILVSLERASKTTALMELGSGLE
jgi:hypothetical protein